MKQLSIQLFSTKVNEGRKKKENKAQSPESILSRQTAADDQVAPPSGEEAALLCAELLSEKVRTLRQQRTELTAAAANAGKDHENVFSHKIQGKCPKSV